MSSDPRVTVLMSVYNAEEYVGQAIESILEQTYKDFELLIINDGSKDKSLQVIKKYKDPRIRLISRANRGLVASLNQGIGLARGEFIARHDADDLSINSRLEKEVVYLDSHPDVGLVGSNYTIIDTDGKELVNTNIFTNPKDLKVALITCNQYGHGSIMMRTSIARKLKGYDKSVGHVEDYDLWIRISRKMNVANIEEPLYLWRKVEQSISHANAELQIKQTFAVRDKAFKHFLENRHSYSLFSYHPTGSNYRARKAMLHRDLAFLYRMHRKTYGAVKMLLLAIFWRPQNRRNYRLLAKTILKPNSPNWEYEFL